MIDDIFCKIINGELKSEPVYQDNRVVVVKDIHPQAPVHLLVIPRQHFDGLGDASQEVLGYLLNVAHKVADEQGLSRGYRIVINEGEHGGKLVPHLHLHLLGGKKLGPKIVVSE